MAQSGVENQIDKYIKQQPDWFENLILGCCIYDLDFFKRVKDVLCRSYHMDEATDDFEEILRNPVYRAIAQYNNAFLLSTQNFLPINEVVMKSMLNNLCGNGEDLMEDEFPKAMQLFMQAATLDITRWKPIVNIGIGRWLEFRKMLQVVKSPFILGGWTLRDIQDKLALVEQQTGLMSDENKVIRGVIGEFIDNPPPMSDERYLPTNLVELNNAMGGGFVKGDTAMCISPPSGGKTIFACQMAGAFSMYGYGGILVTTEQPQVQLERRFVSNFGRIPFKDIVHGFDPFKLPEKQLHGYHQFRRNMKAPIQTVDWTISSRAITTDLRTEVECYMDTFGKAPEYIVFDWLGGAIQEQAGGDDRELRRLYKEACDAVVYMGREHNLAGLVMAQAAPGTSVNKYPIDMRHIAEAKNMAEKVSTIIGLTALYAAGVDEDIDAAQIMWAEKQFLCCSKTRKGQGGNVPVRRRYDYQRIDNW